MLLRWALLCASLLFSSTAASNRIALSRRYPNTTISAPSPFPPPITLPTLTSDDDPLSPPSVIAPSSGQSNDPDTPPNIPTFLTNIPTVVLPVITSTTSCTVLVPGQPRIVYIILPNPVTVTQTLGANYTAPLSSNIPEFTPPIFCPTTGPPFPAPPSATNTSQVIGPSNPSESHSPKGAPSATLSSTDTELNTPFIGTIAASTIDDEGTTTIITTSKNPVTIYTTVAAPLYPGGEDAMNKQTVDPARIDGPNGNSSPFPTDSPRVGDIPVGQVPISIVTTIDGHPIEIQPSYVVVGGNTHSYGDPIETGTGSILAQSGTVLPGGITPNAANPPSQATGDNDTPSSTNVLVVDGGVLTAVGASLVVFDGHTLEYGPSSTFTTEFHRETITLGASISFDGTTIGGAANIGTQLRIAGGVSVTQVGQSVAVISSTSLTIGPQAVITTVYIDSYTIVANFGGLEVYGTTFSYPFNPVTTLLMFEGIAFTKVGSTVVIVSGSTYTIKSASDSKPTSVSRTTSIGRQTGSKGSGSLTTSLDSASPAETSKKSDSNILNPVYILLGICIWTSIYNVL